MPCRVEPYSQSELTNLEYSRSKEDVVPLLNAFTRMYWSIENNNELLTTENKKQLTPLLQSLRKALEELICAYGSLMEKEQFDELSIKAYRAHLYYDKNCGDIESKEKAIKEIQRLGLQNLFFSEE